MSVVEFGDAVNISPSAQIGTNKDSADAYDRSKLEICTHVIHLLQILYGKRIPRMPTRHSYNRSLRTFEYCKFPTP